MYLLLIPFFFFLFIIYIGMTTRFSKAKLAKVQDKKAKGSLTGGLLMRKCQRDMETPKDDPMLTSLIAKSIPQCPTSPTSSLELIASIDGGSKPKGKYKAFMSSFWEDVGVAMLKAHEAIFVDDLSPLGVRPSHELMSSLYILGKYLDYEEKYVKAKSKVESLSAENESLKGQISALTYEAKTDEERLKTLEKSIDTKKAFSKLKDKQIDDALLKVEKASLEAVEKFKASDEYSDKLCDYYVEGFDLFHKYLVKHHPELDFSNLDMEAVETCWLNVSPQKWLEKVEKLLPLTKLLMLISHLLFYLEFFFFGKIKTLLFLGLVVLSTSTCIFLSNNLLGSSVLSI